MDAPSSTAVPGKRTAVIIGAGPAGLTAALELLRRTDIHPIILEATDEVGGLSRTVEHNGNRIDIGGHRFFTKCDRVLQWWQDLMPVEGTAPGIFGEPSGPCAPGAPHLPCHAPVHTSVGHLGSDTATNTASHTSTAATNADAVLLLRQRQSRIYFLRRFFPYPLALTADTLRNLGVRRTVRIAASYLRARLRPIRTEQNLEDFLINRFGRELYTTFFQSYTEKLWGVACNQISADWGAQRIRGLSLLEAVRNCLRGHRQPTPTHTRVAQQATETSLIDRFLYPKLGPGQMWQCAAAEILARGGTIHHGATVDRLCVQPGEAGGKARIAGVEASLASGKRLTLAADYVLSTMPIPALIASLSEPAPAPVRAISEGLVFRDFFTVGVLARSLALKEKDGSPLRDNWIYIQESGVRMTRLQLFENWSPSMVADPGTTWLGVEYVTNEHEDLWRLPDADLQQLAIRELASIGMLDPAQVLDACVVRAPKAYPAYFGTYPRFQEIRDYLARFENLFPIGRNGQHRYNNQDHSMLTAMTAVDGIAVGTPDPVALWSVNTEPTYHEAR